MKRHIPFHAAYAALLILFYSILKNGLLLVPGFAWNAKKDIRKQLIVEKIGWIGF